MDYEERMELEKKKKMKRQTIFLFLSLIILGGVLVGGTYLQKQTNKKQFEEMVFETIENVKENYTNDKLLNQDLPDKTYTFPDKTIVNFDERSLTGGMIIRYSNGDIEIAVYNDDWCAKKSRNVSQISVTEYKNGNCELEK